MNRKLLNFILSGALLFSCVGMFSSCKDTSEDQLATVMGDVNKLDTALKTQLAAAQANIDALTAELNNLKQQIANLPTPEPCTCDLTEINNKINKILADLANAGITEETAPTLATLPERVTTLESQITQIQEEIQNLLADPRLEKLLTLADVENLERVLNEYKVATLPEALEQLIKDVADLQDKKIPADLAERIDNLETAVGNLADELGLKVNQDDLTQAIQDINDAIDAKAKDLQDQIDAIVKDVAKNANDIAAVNTTVGDLKTKLQALIDADFQGQIDTINEKLQELDNIKAEIENLKTLEDRLDHIINSIVIQQVTNKVFGSLLLPLGVETNILMAYHGYNTKDIETFPSSSTSFEYNGGQPFKSSELSGVDKYNVGLVLLDESANNAGNVYFTVNPSNVNLKGSVFTLVNSKDYGCGIELSAPKACDKMLMFGWSRAENGFYVSNAHLSEANIEKCNITLGGELKHEIKVTAKEFLHDLRHLDRPDIPQIATTIKNVLQRFNGQFPANAIRGQYTYNDLEGNKVTAATYSNYGIAAATFEPLSFSFLEGQDNKFDKLPTIPTIDNFEFEMSEIKIEFNTNFQVDKLNVKLEFNKIEINKEDFTVTGTVKVDVYDPETGGFKQEDRPITATAEGIEDLVDKINAELEKIVGQVNEEIIGQVNDMVNSINDQVKEMLDKMSADVNEQLNDLLGDLSDEVNDQLDKYTGRINDLIKKANKLIGRVNNVLAHPNKYLQPLGIYTANNGQDMHVLSTSMVAPSRFYMNGGNATTLYFTSYTLETIAPSFKKFVKVVNAWKNGDATRATVASAVNNANAQGSLNKVVNGDQIRFAFAPEAGYTYEIVFQALDYQGITSTRRCFIEVR